MTGSPLDPQEHERYATPVATKELEEPETGGAPVAGAAGSPAWVKLAVALLIVFGLLLLAWLLFVPRS